MHMSIGFNSNEQICHVERVSDIIMWPSFKLDYKRLYIVRFCMAKDDFDVGIFALLPMMGHLRPLHYGWHVHALAPVVLSLP